MNRPTLAGMPAMLMAAGLGTRLRPFTEIEPKAFVPLMGVPMAQYALDLLAEAGVQRAVINIHHLAEKSRAAIAAMDAADVALEISDESALLLGSGGGIRHALPQLTTSGRTPFFLLNADVLLDVDLRTLAARHAVNRNRFGAKLTLALLDRGPVGGRYREILVSEDGSRITGLGDLAEGRRFFMGAAIVEPEAVQDLEDGPFEFVPRILQPAIEQGKAGAVTFANDGNGVWFDVGDPRCWLDAHLSLIRNLEIGRAPARWRKRIESTNVRVSQGVWVSKRARPAMNPTRWSGPCYWDGPIGMRAPREFGPNAVLYDEASVSELSFGIGLAGRWVSLR